MRTPIETQGSPRLLAGPTCVTTELDGIPLPIVHSIGVVRVEVRRRWPGGSDVLGDSGELRTVSPAPEPPAGADPGTVSSMELAADDRRDRGGRVHRVHLCERLLAEGREVVGVDDLSHGPRQPRPVPEAPGFRFVEMDCRERRGLRRAFAGCQAIVHLAAEKIPRYGGALQDAAGQRRRRRVAVYEAALALDAHVVIASTSDVYGNAHAAVRARTTR